MILSVIRHDTVTSRMAWQRKKTGQLRVEFDVASIIYYTQTNIKQGYTLNSKLSLAHNMQIRIKEDLEVTCLRSGAAFGRFFAIAPSNPSWRGVIVCYANNIHLLWRHTKQKPKPRASPIGEHNKNRTKTDESGAQRVHSIGFKYYTGIITKK